jgi:uncharacterized membrane protein YfcA
MTALVMHVTKLGVYGGTSLLTIKSIVVGVTLGVVLVVGSYLGKRLVDRVSERVFATLIELTLVVAGLYFLVSG